MKTVLIGKGGFGSPEEAFGYAKTVLAPEEDLTFRVEGEVLMTRPAVLDAELLRGRKTLVEGGPGAVITGGIRVTNFRSAGNGLWYASVPEAHYTRTLFLDGKFACRPSTEPITAHGWDLTVGNCDFYEENGEVTGLVTDDPKPLTWKNPRDVEIIFNVGWTHHVIPIRSVERNADGKTVIRPLRVPFDVSREMRGVSIGGCPTCFENVFEEMKQPGEWYFDRTEKKLWLMLAPGDTPARHTVELPLTDRLFLIEGTVEEKVGDLHFRGLTFRCTSFLRPNEYGHSDLQAGFTREGSETEMPQYEKPFELDNLKLPGTVRVIAAKNVTFTDCVFTCLDSTALSFEFGAEDCTVTHCTFRETGAGAMTVGDIGGIRSHHPSDLRETVSGICLTDSTVCNTGRDFFSTAAVLLGYVRNCTVVHNDIHDVPYTGVSVGWGWGNSDVAAGPYRPTPWTTPSVCAGNTVSFNRFTRCMMTLYDGGAVYTLGAMEGTVIEGNCIGNSGGYDGPGCTTLAIAGYQVGHLGLPNGKQYADKGPFPGGIYLDEGSRGITVRNNVIWGAVAPLFYHNQVDEGYRKVEFLDNILNLRPGDEGFPEETAKNAGPRF